MTDMEIFRSKAAFRRLPLAVLLVAFLTLSVLTGCQSDALVEPVTEPTAPEQTLPPETEPPTEPQPTAPADGNPDDVTCKGSYSISNKSIMPHVDTVVATIDDQTLTVGQLQIYYALAINSYRAGQHEAQPDYTQPLDVQLCGIDDTAVTWQQYFLQCALNSWHSHVAMNKLSEKTVIATEEVYRPDQTRHSEYLNEDMPALQFLYGYHTDYRINRFHQEYLDQLPERLKQLAADNGFADETAFLKRLAGMGTTAEDLLAYADTANRGYMLLTELSYRIEPTAQEVESYFARREADYAAQGITRDDYYVEIRHVLILPDNATIAEDGKVTASEESWKQAEKKAGEMLGKWTKNRSAGTFADLAFAQSADDGSSLKGGQYYYIAKGQMIEPLDEWYFNPARKAGEADILRSDYGYHLVYFAGKSDVWYRRAETDYIADQLKLCIAYARECFPMTVDYSRISLNGMPVNELPVTAYDIVYPDIGHERFPEAPLYLQQDYPGVMYGRYPLDKYGCGITTMSMLATYMTDEEWTPPEMAARFGSYCTAKGTAHTLLNEAATDLGFYVKEKVYNWGPALRALEDGYMVISLQGEGFWTRGGHYLLLHELTEDGKLIVRDSNIGNYFKLKGHTEGSFETSTIPGAGRIYWIYQKKVTRIPICARCGEGAENAESELHLPYGMFLQEYICPKCHTAMNRLQAYMDGCAGIS